MEYAPAPQGVHTRSAVLVPFVAMYWPLEQLVQGVHESSLAVAEYAPAPQGAHTRSVILLPFEETYSPAVQDDHVVHVGAGGNEFALTVPYVPEPQEYAQVTP